jgi:hypothetical protein
MQITIKTGIRTEQPTNEDWERLLRYLRDQFIEAEAGALETLECSHVSPPWRDTEQGEARLDKPPIWRTTDDSGFVLWLYADNTDSEG